MGLFSNEAETKRKMSLKELEDKRLRFVELLKQESFSPDAVLYTQQLGGFHGIAKNSQEFYLITGPAPGAEEDFTFRRFSSLQARSEELIIKSEGMGGVLGFGKKGGIGYTFIFTTPDGEEFSIELIAGQNTFLEVSGTNNPLTKPKRRRGNSNFVWDFRPVEREHLEGIKSRWVEPIALAL